MKNENTQGLLYAAEIADVYADAADYDAMNTEDEILITKYREKENLYKNFANALRIEVERLEE